MLKVISLNLEWHYNKFAILTSGLNAYSGYFKSATKWKLLITEEAPVNKVGRSPTLSGFRRAAHEISRGCHSLAPGKETFFFLFGRAKRINYSKNLNRVQLLDLIPKLII
mgnify:CR=1 FL=1